MFSIFRALGLINSLPGLALTSAVANVSFATAIETRTFGSGVVYLRYETTAGAG